jgi:hypothetical protein
MLLSSKTKDLVYLTPDLLSELASIARTKGGCVLEVKDARNMTNIGQYESSFAYILFEGDIGFGGHTVRRNTISLINVIDVEALRTLHRPEMSYESIPRDQIYRFIIYHEIGHALLNPIWPKSKIIRNIDGTVNQDETEIVQWAGEMRADRFAWKSLFPLQPFPRREGCESMVRSLEAVMWSHKDLFAEPRVPKPL